MLNTKGKKNSKVELLHSVDLFRSCSDAECRRLATVVDEIELPAGRVLIEEGRRGAEAFVLACGEAEVTIGGALVATIGPGAVIGEMALVDRGPRAATVTLSTDALVLVIEAQRFRGVLAEMPAVSSKVLGSLSRRLRDAESASRPTVI